MTVISASIRASQSDRGNVRLGADVLPGLAPPSRSKASLGLADLGDGLRQYWLWLSLALQDIKLRYRGSLLGPFWVTLNTAIMIGSMGVVYAELFRVDVRSYLPFVACGLVVWQFISTSVTEGCFAFLSAQQIMQQVKLPLSSHVYRVVARNVMVLLHNLVIIPIVLVWFRVDVGSKIILFVPAMLVLALNSIWLSLVVGMISARFRDVPPIIASLVQAVFFVTPVLWNPQALGRWTYVAELNPFAAALDIARAPLLGQSPADVSWPLMIGLTVMGCLITFALFSRFRSRIAYWI